MKTSKGIQILISLAEGIGVSIAPLIYADIIKLLPNYLTGISLSLIIGIINVIYDVVIKKQPVKVS